MGLHRKKRQGIGVTFWVVVTIVLAALMVACAAIVPGLVGKVTS